MGFITHNPLKMSSTTSNSLGCMGLILTNSFICLVFSAIWPGSLSRGSGLSLFGSDVNHLRVLATVIKALPSCLRRGGSHNGRSHLC
jgi:hypothetical protein